MNHPPDHQHAGEKYPQHEEIHVQRILQVDQAEQPPARNPLDAVLAVGEGGLQAKEEEHLRQCQGDHRRVDALPTYRQEADHQPQQRRAGDADENPQLRRQPPFLHRMGGEIGRTAEECRMPEGKDAGIAQQQVEGAGEQRETEHLHDEDRIEVEGRQYQRGDAEQDQYGFQAYQWAPGRGDGAAGLAVHQVSLPIRPAGRTSSTIAMTTKITMFEASG